jgi:uncharacterized protein (DUF433 family)
MEYVYVARHHKDEAVVEKDLVVFGLAFDDNVVGLLERWCIGRRPVVIALEWTKRHVDLARRYAVQPDRHHWLVDRSRWVCRRLRVSAAVDWNGRPTGFRRHQDAATGHGMSVVAGVVEPRLPAADVVRIKGHCIGLEHIVERYAEGFSAEQIAQEYPGVELKAIYAISAYYLHNQAAVDAYVARSDATAEARRQEWAANMPEISRRVRAIIAQRQQEAHT